MARIIFPENPLAGDRVVGPNGAVWEWDGNKWVALGGVGPQIIEEGPLDGFNYGRQMRGWARVAIQNDAPFDGQRYIRSNGGWLAIGAGVLLDSVHDGTTYARNNGFWINVVPQTGGTFTGTIRVQGNGNFEHDLYVDKNLRILGDSVFEGDASVRKDLVVEGHTTVEGLTARDAAKFEDDVRVEGDLHVNGIWVGDDLTVARDLTVKRDTELEKLTVNDEASFADTLHAAGAASFGSTVLLHADPTLNLQAATKQYTDARGVPDGGTPGQALTKSTAANRSLIWRTLVPAAGTLGQALTKVDATDYNSHWQTLVPTGGAVGTVLRKNTATNFDASWSTNGTVPAGGATGAALIKSSTADYAVTWQVLVPTGGSAGQMLRKNSSTNWDWSWVTPIPAGGALYQVLQKNSATTDYSVAWTWTGVRGNSNVILGNADTMAAQPGGLSKNVVIGSGALKSMTTGYDDVCIGYNCWPNSTIHSSNVVIGSEAMLDWTTNDQVNSVYIGYRAGQYLNQSGGASHTVAVGANSASTTTITAAPSGVYIGSSARPAGNNQTNQIAIGASCIGNGANTVTLGNTSILATNGLWCRSTAIAQSCDIRLKQHVETANLDLCLDAVKRLPVRRFHWNEAYTRSNDYTVTGFVADDIEKVFPKSVVTRDEDYENGLKLKDVKGSGNDQALPTLWGCVQKLIQRVEELEEELGRSRASGLRQ